MPGPKLAGPGVVLRFVLSPSGITRIRRAPRARPITGEQFVARIAGVNLPTNKRVIIALQYIHGIGQKNAKDIMKNLNLPEERRVSQLTDAEVLQIRELIDMYDSAPESSQLARLLEVLARQRAKLKQQREDIDAVLGELDALEGQCRALLKAKN